MLTIVIPARKLYNERTGEIVSMPETKLTMEHSLISISKWESKWHKNFLDNKNKTPEELYDYIYDMIVTPSNVNPSIVSAMTADNIKSINDYISDPMTATKFFTMPGANPGPQKQETVTAEIIYYWMIALQIPIEFEKWHINRLLTLIKVCDIKSNPKRKKMGIKDTIASYKDINERRKAEIAEYKRTHPNEVSK